MGTGAIEIVFDKIMNNKSIRENEKEIKKRVAILFKSIHYDRKYAWTEQDINNAWEGLKSQNYFEQEIIRTKEKLIEVPQTNIEEKSREELENNINMTTIPTPITSTKQKFIEEINFKNQKETIEDKDKFQDKEFKMDEDFQNQLLEALKRIGNPEQNIATTTTFKGTIEEDPIEWLKNFNNVAEANNWTKQTKLGILRTCLKGDALEWFEEHEDEITRWKNPHERENDNYDEADNGYHFLFHVDFSIL